MDDKEKNLTPSEQQPAVSAPSLWSILRRRWWLIGLLMIGAVSVTLIGSLNAPPSFRSSMRLQALVLDEQEITLYTRLATADAAEQIFVTQNNFRDVLNSPLIAWRTINDLGLDMNADELLSGLSISVSGEFVTVTYQADSARKAQDILAQHVNNALEHYSALRSRPAVTTGQFIQAELEKQAEAFAAAQEALLQFKLEHNVGDLDREINAVQDVLRGLEASRTAALIEAGRAEALAAQWEQYAEEAEAAAEVARQQLRASSPLTATAGAAGSPVAGALLPGQEDQIARLQAEIARQEEMARTYQDNARTQAANAAAQQAVAAGQEAAISQRRADLTQLISLSSEYNALLVAVRNTQADRDFLRTKAVEARLKERQINEIGFLQVVEPPYLPAAPAPSATLRLVLLAALVSLLAGLVLVLLWELVRPGRATVAQPGDQQKQDQPSASTPAS